MFRRLVRLGGTLAVVLWATAVMASPPNTELLCAEGPAELDQYRYLRAISFDLRGKPPSAGEVRVLRDSEEGDVPEWLIDRWLDDEAFVDQVVRRHRSYLWNNISNVRLVNRRTEIGAVRGIWWARIRADTYRPSPIRRPHCGDFEAEFDEDGTIQTRMNAEGVPQEGYVYVTPYWAPETSIQICAFDGQQNTHAADGTPCDLRAGLEHIGCGCGPNLIYCAPNQIREQIKSSMGRSIELTVAAIIRDQEPYTALFESRRFFVNGPMVHFYRYFAQSGQARFNPLPIKRALLPDIDVNAGDDWREMEVGQHHAGVLTHPAYLMRFQTNRARASRFYQGFLCSPFQPPVGGLPPADDEAARNPDLQERAGCKYCHSGLEPAAAHWGRWNQLGAGFIDPGDYPAADPECIACANRTGPCTQRCRDHYLTRALDDQETPYLGLLKAFVFRREEHMHHVDFGPKLLARTTTADNRLPLCVAQQTAAWLLGRGLDRPGDAKWLTALSVEFARSDFSYRALVKAILTSDRYRRVQ